MNGIPRWMATFHIKLTPSAVYDIAFKMLQAWTFDNVGSMLKNSILKFEGPEQKVKGPGQKLQAIGLRAGTMSNTA